MRALGEDFGRLPGALFLSGKAAGNIIWENRLGLSNALDIPIVDFLPPEMATNDFKIQEPEERLLVERYRRLPRKLREVYLRYDNRPVRISGGSTAAGSHRAKSATVIVSNT